MAILQRPTELSPAATDELVTRRLEERIPIIGLAVLGCLSVGFGFGTLVQFDHDWRDAPPVLITSVEGSAAEGAAIDQAIEDLLAGTARPVHDVQCQERLTPEVQGQDQLCRASTASGMVSIVASTSPGLLRVQVFASD
jgi:hypothetical protein